MAAIHSPIDAPIPLLEAAAGMSATAVSPFSLELGLGLALGFSLSPTDIFVAFGWLVITVFVLANGGYVLLNLTALLGLRDLIADRRWRPDYDLHSSPFAPGIAVIVPAYNEAPTIVSSVQSLLNVAYPDVEIVVVNDGSTDATLERLAGAYDLREVEASIPLDVPCERIEAVYRATDVDLLVVDKANGGKADALNAGVYTTDQPLFCAVDADSLLERTALSEVVEPFLRDPDRVVATGGTVRAANGCTVHNGTIRSVGLGRSWVVRLQTMEYLRAFLVGRLGLNHLDAVPLISGAFGLFRTDVVRDVGGYPTDSVTEDLELVVRLHRRLSEAGEDYRIVFVPTPVAWTEVPESLSSLSSQRRRWFRGLLWTLRRNRTMLGSRQYGLLGVVVLPFILLAEVIGPLVEALGYIIIPLTFLLGFVHTELFVLFLAASIGLGAIASGLAVLAEVIGFRRYDDPKSVAILLVSGLLEHVGYRQWRAVVCWYGFLEFLRGSEVWGEMTRTGFREESDA